MKFFFISVAVSATCAIGAPKLNDADVSNAITMIVKELDSRHDEDRCWDSANPSYGWLSKHRGGTTALATLAMLSAGESSNSPKIKNSLDYIWNIEEPSSYLLTLRTSIWAMLPDTYIRRLKKDTKRLIKTMHPQYGGWGVDASDPLSVSSTSPLTREFGIIAFREAQRRGESIPKKCLASIANATISTQHPNGGWSYEQSSTRGTPTPNMTVAGLNCLLGVNEVLGNELNTNESKLLQTSIDNALSWLDKHAITKNTGGTTLMSYLYALERAAMSCGLSKVSNRDWFIDGAKAVLDSHCGVRKAKGSTVNLSFALLFLTRGRAPIALCELVQQKGAVDPHRVADTITKRVAMKSERNLSWQLVTNNESVNTWLIAPFLFIQDTCAIPEDISKCKEYLDRGGLLVMLATGKELRACKDFASLLCPNIKPIENQSDHWTHNLLDDARNVRLTIWNDGIRDRILTIQGNAKKYMQSKNSTLSTLLTNLCCGAAELDRWKPRLHTKEPSSSSIPFVIAEHDGRWNAEIAAFHHWKTKSMPLSQAVKKRVVWVGGIDSSEVTMKLIEELIEVASTGSTVVVESIGGQGHFAATTRKKLAEKTHTIVEPDTKLQNISGRRGWSIVNRKRLPIPLVTTIGKGKVIFIDCDIRNALLNQTAWGIHGYSQSSAEELVQLVLSK